MLKPLKEIGFGKALKFAIFSPLLFVFEILPYPQLRIIFLRLCGAKIGKNTIIGRVRFANVYRTGFGGLNFGNSCFIGDYVTMDLAEKITLEDHVTLSFGTMLVTHRNVGYKDHPLQAHFPSTAAPIHIKKGVFVGVNAILLNGVTVGECACVGAGALVKENVDAWTVVGGIPAKVLKKIK